MSPWFTNVCIVQEAVSVPDGLRAQITLAYGDQELDRGALIMVTGELSMSRQTQYFTEPIGVSIQEFPTVLLRLIEPERRWSI